MKISQMLPSNTNPTKSNGFLFITTNGFYEKYLLEIGNAPLDKKEKYWSLAQEKAYRLYSDWLRDEKSLSSWQTKDPDMSRYGGAILLNNYENDLLVQKIISFSGLTEKADEAVSMALGHYLNWTSMSYLDKIAEISENKLFYEMMLKVK